MTTPAEDVRDKFSKRLQETLEFDDEAFNILSEQIQKECETKCKEGIYSEDCRKTMDESLDLMFKDGTKFAPMKSLEAVQFSCQHMVKIHSPQSFLNTCVESKDTSKPNEQYDEELCKLLAGKSAQVEALFVN